MSINTAATVPSSDLPEQALPLGECSFTSLRELKAVYVDKTAQIHALARTKGFYFLARPRRFGKSLLVSTLDALFRGEKESFQGLAIASLWQDHPYDPESRIICRQNTANNHGRTPFGSTI